MLAKSATRRFRVPSQQPKPERRLTAFPETRGDVQTDNRGSRRRHSGRAQAPRRSAGCRTDRAATMNDLLSSVKVRASARA